MRTVFAVALFFAGIGCAELVHWLLRAYDRLCCAFVNAMSECSDGQLVHGQARKEGPQ